MKLETLRRVTVAGVVAVAGLGLATQPALASDKAVTVTHRAYTAKADNHPGNGKKGWVWVGSTSNEQAHVDYFLVGDSEMHTLYSEVPRGQAYQSFDKAVKSIRVCGHDPGELSGDGCSYGGDFLSVPQ
ncbi:hypothetical protein LWC34_54380 [Kibdelosporangium philippinense]|uniref:Uncharacterized protein n=1 Tax=Kibdelosporangium philippinense TaxID=211113 RepID=A0ABS8ZVL4_9PSEU|nr:hypothetical protein [Kibdelosporangium philippinense]MCE7011747.1 hypothetical protein [Kibdelosporangium philippinense]